MQPSLRSAIWIVICLGTGIGAFYFGFFYAGNVCDGASGACHFKAAFTPEPLVLLVGAVFFLFGLWLAYLTLIRPQRR
jgi:hypothetical protein